MLRKVVLVVVLLALTGCGGGDKSSSTSADAPTATPSKPTESAASPSAPPSASPPAVPPNVGANALQVGQWREGRDIRTRVRALTQPSDIHPPSYLIGESDAEGAIADVEMCVRMSSTYVLKGSLYDAFHVYDKSGGQYSQASSSWDEWPPRPQFPSDDVKLTPGRCVHGWILFSVPRGTRVQSIANDGQGEATAEWIVR